MSDNGQVGEWKWIRGSSKLGGIPNDAISTLSKLLCDCVSLINDEVLIEDLEDLATSHIRHDVGEFRIEVWKMCSKAMN